MSDHKAYQKFLGKAEFDKAVNSLLGLIEGITIDSLINDDEIIFLEQWLNDHRIRSDKHPFTELFPVVEQAISDKVLTDEEVQDIKWLCDKLTSNEYFNTATTDMQKLHAILAAVGSDGSITEKELNGITSWLNDHEHLKTCWPYDEIESLITNVMSDQKIDPDEHKALLSFFGEFVSILDNKTIVNPAVSDSSNIVGLCAVCPEIDFTDAVFCLTGSSYKFNRNDFKKVIEDLGGLTSDSVTKNVDYLVIGADGNPCWAYACYGRKVEKAVELRKKGHNLMIVHENDLHDAISDL